MNFQVPAWFFFLPADIRQVSWLIHHRAGDAFPAGTASDCPFVTDNAHVLRIYSDGLAQAFDLFPF